MEEEGKVDFTEQELLQGKTKIPLSHVFPFLFDYITKNFQTEIGVSTNLDRNFLFLQQMVTRQRIQSINGYHCLQPLIEGKNEKHLTVASIQKHTSMYVQQRLVSKDCYTLFILHPSKSEEEKDLLQFHEFFSNEMKPTIAEEIDFGHILKALYQCIMEHQFNITITSKDGEIIWTMTYKDGHVNVYKIANFPPQCDTEKQLLCKWISVSDPIFERNVAPYQHFYFNDRTVEAIKRDPDAKSSADGVVIGEEGEKCMDCLT